jgi:hypothetical protein
VHETATVATRSSLQDTFTDLRTRQTSIIATG